MDIHIAEQSSAALRASQTLSSLSFRSKIWASCFHVFELKNYKKVKSVKTQAKVFLCLEPRVLPMMRGHLFLITARPALLLPETKLLLLGGPRFYILAHQSRSTFGFKRQLFQLIMLKLIFDLTFFFLFSLCHTKMHNLTGQLGQHLRFTCKIKQGSKYTRNEFELYREDRLILGCDLDYWGNITSCHGLHPPWQMEVKLPSRVRIFKFMTQPDDEGTYKCLTKVYSVSQNMMAEVEVDGYLPIYLPAIHYYVKIQPTSSSPELFDGKIFAFKNRTLCSKDFYDFTCYSNSSFNTSINIVQGQYEYSHFEIIQRLSPENDASQIICCTDLDDCKSVILDPCNDHYYYFYNSTKINYHFITGHRVFLSKIGIPSECDLTNPIMDEIIAYYRELEVISLVFIITYLVSSIFLLAIVANCLAMLRRLFITLEDRTAAPHANTFRLSEISLSTEEAISV